MDRSRLLDRRTFLAQTAGTLATTWTAAAVARAEPSAAAMQAASADADGMYYAYLTFPEGAGDPKPANVKDPEPNP